MSIIAVLRHSDYSDKEDIGERYRAISEKRGRKLIQEMGISAAVDSLLIVSSTAPRALQTTQSLRSGLGLGESHPIYTTEFLYDDNTHGGDIGKAIAFIKQLPNSLFLLVVTHKDFVINIARGLGYNGEIPTEVLDLTDGGVKYLEGFVFDANQAALPNEKEGALPSHGEISGEKYREYEFALTSDFRAIDVVRMISSLQSQKGTWQKIQDADGSEYQFLVPFVLPNVDPEAAMNGTIDREGLFALKVQYDEESDFYHAGKHKDIPTISQFQALEWIFGKLEDMNFPF